MSVVIFKQNMNAWDCCIPFKPLKKMVCYDSMKQLFEEKQNIPVDCPVMLPQEVQVKQYGYRGLDVGSAGTMTGKKDKNGKSYYRHRPDRS